MKKTKKINVPDAYKLAATQVSKAPKMTMKLLHAKITPDQMYQNLENYTDLVVDEIQPSLVVTGSPGVGKTHCVKQRVIDRGLEIHKDFVHVKGRATPAGLYYTLYEHSDKLIIFDDCDSVFKDDEAVNILKGALDSYDERVVSYISTKMIKDADGIPLPTSFTFTGRIIFISNLPLHKVDKAIRSRSFVIDITLSTQQMLDRMESLLHKVEPKIKMEVKKEAFKCLKEVYQKFEGIDLNMRSLIKAIRIRARKYENWHMMIAEQCFDPDFKDN